LVGSALVGLAAAKPEEDRVLYLPEMGNFDKYAMYSGYVDIPATGSKQLHYLLVESQNNPATDPLIIWFNGGPGCSSMLGFAQEHGPFVVPDGGQTFVPNPYSWNLEANMLYIESPAGVGYSYGQTEADRTFDDTTSA
jgi:cathepsin A (carboxypeptidase C)